MKATNKNYLKLAATLQPRQDGSVDLLAAILEVLRASPDELGKKLDEASFGSPYESNESNDQTWTLNAHGSARRLRANF